MKGCEIFIYRSDFFLALQMHVFNSQASHGYLIKRLKFDVS